MRSQLHARSEGRSARSRRSAARRMKAATSMWLHTSLSISILPSRLTSHRRTAAMMKIPGAALLLPQSRVALNPNHNLNVSPKKNGAQPPASQSHPSSNVSRRNIRNAALQTVEEAPTPTASSRCKFSAFSFISSFQCSLNIAIPPPQPP